MIATSYIESSLKELDKLYNESSSQKKAIYFSKLALIELCGWIEESVDDILRTHANRNLKEVINKNNYEKQVIKRTHGFQYDQNIRPMFIQLIGLIHTEKLERKLERRALITLLRNYFSNLKTARNEAAHTHLKGITRTYNAPSHTINDYTNILSVLKEIDNELRN